ncbi:hypothetical protein GGI07_003421 [Coemansia sp. Benny D115]|nr:hypothetical protein GGI07_003421 [Coemansia sp. Benny D115]
MYIIKLLQLVAICVPFFGCAVSAHGGKLVVRGGILNADLSKTRGAALAKNGTLTSCEIALFGIDSGFVAANCFDFNDKKSLGLNEGTKYEVYLYDGSGISAPTIVPLDHANINIHLSYNAATYEYNMAVITFRSGVSEDSLTYISDFPFVKTQSSYVLRSINPGTKKWNVQNFVEMPDMEDADCPRWSGVYAKNDFVELCTSTMVSSKASETCPIPYSALYTTSQGVVGVLALYSHSVVFGTDACDGNARWLNYYSYLNKYIGFALYIVNRNFNVFNTSDITTTNQEAAVSLFISNEPDNIDFSGKLQVSGDSFARIAATDPSKYENPSLGAASTTATTATQSSSTPTDGARETTAPRDTGLSTGAKIGIGVAVPVVVLAVVAVLFYFMWFKKWRFNRTWNPNAEAIHIESIANDLATDIPHVRPPPPYFRAVAPEVEHSDTPAASEQIEYEDKK